MTDQQTTIADLRLLIQTFVDARDWQQFHSPKNLSMALAIEAAELMEHFQWISMDASCEIKDDPVRQAAVGEELADVIAYALAMANVLGLDVSDTVSRKMQKNAIKYPAEEFRGRFGSQPEY
ncbi:MAG: nucleotide pyrophosphohydrolase [Pirellulaceae bacterium]|nr:nucleotide pyrophosphohydrolase [Pirellulaceae bacterium]|tara:strand:- start:441 stop:806 length:366 start_codon:yes stop_codon:yes gene_type:complete